MNIYNLIKLFLIIFLLGYILKTTRCSEYASWILVFTFFLIDDVLLLHQIIGAQLYNIIDVSLPPRCYELAVLAIVGLILLAILVKAYISGSYTFRNISIDMLLFIAALVLFGLIVDLAKVIKLGPIIISSLRIIEDGGELVIDSLIVWYVFLLVMQKGQPELFLHDILFKSRTG